MIDDSGFAFIMQLSPHMYTEVRQSFYPDMLIKSK